MKKKIGVLAVFLFFMSVSLGLAMPLYYVVDDDGVANTTNGGPFSITPYSPAGTAFDSFCIETGEFVTLGGPNNAFGYYYGSIEDEVMYSTGGGLTYVDINTQKLYNYYLANEATLTDAQDGLIQMAIWDYQNQVGYDNTQGANPFFINAPSYALTYDVKALNLWTADLQSDRTKAQSMLVVTGVHVPEPGMLILLGLGLMGVAGLRRKM